MTRLRELARRVGGLAGRRRWIFAFLCGTLATATLPPFLIFPLIIPAYAGLYWLVMSAPTARQAFIDGWWWGWGYFITGLYWICVALLTDVKFLWLIPPTLLGLTALMALYYGAACWLFARLKARGAAGACIFSGLWLAAEYARGHWFTGFPWNLAGDGFAFSDAALQMASLVGAYGLTWFTVLLGTSVATVAEAPVPGREKANILFAAAVWSVFFAGLGWGDLRLREANAVPKSEHFVPGITLRLVQANISQPHKWDPRLQMQGLQENVRLTQLPGLERITHVIWPETAVPYVVRAETPLVRMLGAAVPEKTLLITGALRSQGEESRFQIWNSLMAIDHAGEVAGSYDKHKLVPFGEFLPLRSWLPKAWLTPVGDLDFSFGAPTQAMLWPGLPPLVPMVCYEAIFPGQADSGGEAQMLLNVTNDAWFGKSTGPYQHFQMARMRAVEQGVPLVRVANTGITAVTDAYGQVEAELELGRSGILDVALPKALAYTTYTRFNNIFLLLIAFATMVLILRQHKMQKN